MKTIRVLYIDDEVVLTRVIKRLLELTGHYQVLALNEGKDVIERALSFLPDIFLLDATLPGSDGIEIAYTVRNHPLLADIPIVFYTASNATFPHPKLQKPATTEKLQEFLEQNLAKTSTKAARPQPSALRARLHR